MKTYDHFHIWLSFLHALSFNMNCYGEWGALTADAWQSIFEHLDYLTLRLCMVLNRTVSSLIRKIVSSRKSSIFRFVPDVHSNHMRSIGNVLHVSDVCAIPHGYVALVWYYDKSGYRSSSFQHPSNGMSKYELSKAVLMVFDWKNRIRKHISLPIRAKNNLPYRDMRASCTDDHGNVWFLSETTDLNVCNLDDCQTTTISLAASIESMNAYSMKIHPRTGDRIILLQCRQRNDRCGHTCMTVCLLNASTHTRGPMHCCKCLFALDGAVLYSNLRYFTIDPDGLVWIGLVGRVGNDFVVVSIDSPSPRRLSFDVSFVPNSTIYTASPFACDADGNIYIFFESLDRNDYRIYAVNSKDNHAVRLLPSIPLRMLNRDTTLRLQMTLAYDGSWLVWATDDCIVHRLSLYMK